jgi:hypothetical protein
MVAVFEGSAGRKQKAGRLLLAVGGVALFLQVWALWLEAGAALSRGAADSLGWLGAVGMAMLQAADFIAWNPNGILLSVTRLLLLCWPLAVMMAGVLLSRKAD